MREIETERLLLRGWKLEDAEDFYEYSKHPDVGPNAGWKPHASIEESRGLLREWVKEDGPDTLWAVVDKESGRAIGSIGLHEDGSRPDVPDGKMLGYVLSADHWGRGLMTEAVNAILDYAFLDMRLKLVSVNHYSINRRSRRVIEKTGFVYEGTLRRGTVIFDGSIRDLCMYSMTRREYFLLRARERYVLKLPEEVPMEKAISYQTEWAGQKIIPATMDFKGREYEAWLKSNMAMRSKAPSGLVPATSYFFTDSSGEILGALDLRHTLNENLLAVGGHIGYAIRPAFRKRNLAPYMLALGLQKAGEMEIHRVLITCNEGNLASAATIEACGGVLENTVTGENGEKICRYWIDL